MITLRASATFISNLRGQVVGGTISSLLVGGLTAWPRGLTFHPVLLVIVGVPLLVLGLLGVEVFRRNRRITRDADNLYLRTTLGVTRRIPMSRIHTAIFVPQFGTGTPECRLVLRDRFGSTLLRVDSFLWDPLGIALLATTMPSILEVLPSGLTRREVYRQFPQSANFWERRGRAGYWLFLGALVLAGVVFILILALLMGLPF